MSGLPALLMAFEAGFRAAERGENPQAALAKFAALLTDEPKQPVPAKDPSQ